jgi:hypothetical protein
LLSLPEGRFLIGTPSDQPLVTDSNGATVRRWMTGGISGVARYDDLLMFADAQHVWASDLELNQLWRLTWPGKSPRIDCYLEGTFYWADQNEVKYCTSDGRSGTFGRLAEGLIAGASTLELCYGTPLIVPLKDGRQDLVIAVPNEVWGMNPETGKLRWFAKTRLEGNVSPSVVAKDDLVIAFGGYPATTSIAVRAGGKGDVTASRVAWTSKYSSYVSSPVIHGDHLF